MGPPVRFRDGAKKAGRGVLWALLPMRALESLSASKDSLSRIGKMLRTGEGEPLYDAKEPTHTELEEAHLVEQGRKIVLGMEEHERFDLYVSSMEWTDDALAAQMTSIRRSHSIRLSMLYIVLLLIPGMVWRYGFWTVLYTGPFALYLAVICLKSACFYTQLNERALWTFRQLRERPEFWLLKRAFWYLD